jgi:hypothetical protein
MTVKNSHFRTGASGSWHLPAIAFFALGLLAGVAFAVGAPVVAIRTLGGLAAASGLLGIATVVYTAHFENPLLFSAWQARADVLRVAMRARKREWAEQVQHVDRYLQNAVWSAMG